MKSFQGYEHTNIQIHQMISGDEQSVQLFEYYRKLKVPQYQRKNKNADCFVISVDLDKIIIQSNYFIGLDWICKHNKSSIYIAPKVNQQLIQDFETSMDAENETLETSRESASLKELDYLGMFLKAMEDPLVAKELDGLLFIDWNAERILIESKDEILSPFLIVQYLSILKKIVQKGLKKAYYKVEEHLKNRVKGKILIAATIKHNILKRNLIDTICGYQEYGINNIENRFLKKVLRFVQHYVAKHSKVFRNSLSSVNQLINYSLSAFEMVSDDIPENELKQYKGNVFYREYAEAIRIGGYILKRFSYSVSQIDKNEIATPPFWIDMPRLFELYVYQQLLALFPRQVEYRFSTYGNELDFLITHPEHKMVVDAKYKLHYRHQDNHNDMRQVSGYARLNKVYKALKMESSNEILDCLIIYPNVSNDGDDVLPVFDQIKTMARYKIKGYRNFYKVGIKLPV